MQEQVQYVNELIPEVSLIAALCSRECAKPFSLLIPKTLIV